MNNSDFYLVAELDYEEGWPTEPSSLSIYGGLVWFQNKCICWKILSEKNYLWVYPIVSLAQQQMKNEFIVHKLLRNVYIWIPHISNASNTI